MNLKLRTKVEAELARIHARHAKSTASVAADAANARAEVEQLRGKANAARELLREEGGRLEGEKVAQEQALATEEARLLALKGLLTLRGVFTTHIYCICLPPGMC